MKSYTELDVWIKCRQLASTVYSITKQFPKEELFGLANQMRRAAVSVVSNIAEGCGRQTAKEAVQFLYMSRGSLYELETQVYIAFDQQYIGSTELDKTLEEITACKQLVHGFINYFRGLANPRTTNNQ
ncbi:four helix bundle protein [Nibribacter ruber]|uniref:Four helix bundle protein n=1 Tax=Nibribacter ruber TaxID=2698458 RepID=A0A6P1NY82_9BACT|nr:four helix bundle protein [Nibribacter ruber]QHL86898.1 four helix bundle protein [Nibribacter ruber]